MSVEIRKMEKNELPAVARLQLKLLQEHAAHDPSDTPSHNASKHWIKYIRKELRTGNAILLVASENKKIVGYVFGHVKKRPPVVKEPMTGYISDIYVEKRYRKQKIGVKLLEQALDFFRAAGLPSVELHVSSWNKKALRFYEKQGFKEYMKKLWIEL